MLPYFFRAGLLLLILGCGTSLSAQIEENGYEFHYKVVDGEMSLRWVPMSWPEFQHAINGGLTLEVYSIAGTLTKPEAQLLESKKMAPIPYEEWRAKLPSNQWDTSAIASVYIDQIDPALREDSYFAKEYEDDQALEQEGRWKLSAYSLRYDWEAIERSGMGYRLEVNEKVERYACKLYPTATGDTLFFEMEAANYEEPSLPELSAEWMNKRAELVWRTLEYRNDYFAWHLERSIGAGPFEDVFELPLINPSDTLERKDEELKFLHYVNRFENNEEEIVFRLRGQDFMGGKSIAYREVKGSGLEDLRFSPLLTETIQTDSNYAVINWEFEEDQEKILQEFRIVHTDSQGTNYRLAVAGIDRSVRQAVVPMKFDANYYRVQAVSIYGTVYSSFESLILSYDVDPPAMPRDFAGYIDSSGITHLSWMTSNEPDLKGYYLFKGYYRNEELAMITPKSLPGPTHLDTTDVALARDTIYYQMRSVDFRGNSSNFTPVLALKKADIYPPAPPRFTKISDKGQSVNLRWVSSPSPDAQDYVLYRRDLAVEKDWTAIASWTADEYRASYRDTLVRAGQTYAYTIQVTDDDGLESDPAQPVSMRVRDIGLMSKIQTFSLLPDEKERVMVINWDYEEAPQEFHLYRGIKDEPVSLLKVVSGNLRTYRDEGLRRKTTYRYLLRAIFPNGKLSPFTEQISGQIE